MTYLVHTAHLQFAGLWLGFVGWILMAVSMGLVQWRAWHVANNTNITSGVAWVGIWRACFLSRVLVTTELEILFCQYIRLGDPSTPPEISVAQVLVPVALIVGAGGNACALYGLRRVYFGMGQMKTLRVAFSVAGTLSVLSGVCSMLPLAWNMRSVVANHTIDFPPEFHMPPAPVRQDVGGGISLGILSSILTILSGLMFILYGIPEAVRHRWDSRAYYSGPNQNAHGNHTQASTRSHGNTSQAASTDHGNHAEVAARSHGNTSQAASTDHGNHAQVAPQSQSSYVQSAVSTPVSLTNWYVKSLQNARDNPAFELEENV